VIQFEAFGMIFRAGMAGSWLSLRVVLGRRYVHLAVGRLFVEISEYPF